MRHVPGRDTGPDDEVHLHERRTIALHTSLLRQTELLDDAQIDGIMSPVFRDSLHSSENSHLLVCGHEVFCHLSRECAVNCTRTQIADGEKAPNSGHVNAIICSECVLRAEVVYARFARADADREAREYEQVAGRGQ
jgi:hypothetical protein